MSENFFRFTEYRVFLGAKPDPKQIFVSLDMSNYICEVILNNLF